MKKTNLPVLVGLILLISLACGFPSQSRVSATRAAATTTQTKVVLATAVPKAVSPSSIPVKLATATTRPQATATIRLQATATTRPQATATTQHSGGQIVFLSCKSAAYLSKGTHCGIHIANADGSNIRQLTDNDSDGSISLSPDGTRMLFSRKEQNYERYEMYTDGSGLKHLPNGPEGSIACCWSPDGSQIIYISNSSACAIFALDNDGNNPRTLMNSSDCDSYGLRWSPDGSQIVFVTNIVNVSSTLHIMNADGSQARVIKTSPAIVIELPRWSPDGTKIAFLNQKTFDAPIEVDVINKDGTNQHSLTAGFYPVFGGLSWSPDGQQLIFNMDGDGKSLEGATHIFVVNADGSNVHRLKVGCPGYSCSNAEWGH